MSKVAALLNMLSSDNDGERANAARMLSALAVKANKTVSDFVMSPQVVYRDRIVEKVVYKDRIVEKVVHKDRAVKKATRPSILEALREAQDMPEILTGFEAEFIDSVLSKYACDEDLSSRQERVARQIIVKMELRS